MRPEDLPAEIVTRFRAKALERIEKLEACWLELTGGRGGDAVLHEEIQRELHTLKGDSRVVGFTDLNLICHKLEDLLVVAHGRRYQVTEDFDLVMSMGFRFLAMLLRKKTGAALGGIDLPGFITELETVLKDASLVEVQAEHRAATLSEPRRQRKADRVSLEMRQRLAAVATTVFLEQLDQRGERARRLREVWTALRRELADLGGVALAPLLAPHVGGTEQLARDQGKEVQVRLILEDGHVSTEVGEALNTALLHILRNAVAHGIEAPLVRQRMRKHGIGVIEIRARCRAEVLEVEIEDDGGGLDFAAITQRGHERGLLPAKRVTDPSQSDLIDLMFQPGFSTSATINDLAGRGVGLDAVRHALAAIGGNIAVMSRHGHGTTFVLRLPGASMRLPVLCFAAPGDPGVRFAISASWQPIAGDVLSPIDPWLVLGLTSPPSGPSQVLGFRDPHRAAPVGFIAGGPATAAIAERICPTADDCASEIVLVDGVEVALLRPHMLPA